MKTWTRREFVGLAGATLLAALGPKAARGQAAPRVVVVGGGIGGATVARYLAASTAPIDVTLVEPKERYITCFFSNLYLAGLRTLDSLSHGYEALAEKSGIKVIHEAATRHRSRCKDGGACRAAPGSPTTGSCSLPASLSSSTPLRATTRRRRRSCRTPGMPGRRASCCAGSWKAWTTAAFS